MPQQVREVAGAFHDADALEQAAQELLSSGFDRERLSLLGTDAAVRAKFGPRMVSVQQVEDDPETPRIAFVNRDDLAVGKGAVIGGLLYIGVLVGTGAVIASGGMLLPALAVAAAEGAGSAGLGTVLASRLERGTADKISDEVKRGGLVLRARSPERRREQRRLSHHARKRGPEHARPWQRRSMIALLPSRPDESSKQMARMHKPEGGCSEPRTSRSA